MAARVLVLDYGTTALKAVAYDEDFTPLKVASREWRYERPMPGWVEHSAERYWDVTVDAVREVGAAIGGFSGLAALSVTGQAETLLPLDAHGVPLGDAIVWVDGRAQAECDRAARTFPAEALYARTGNPGFDPIMPVLKIAWMKENQPERFAATDKFLLLKDYAAYRLTGQMITEHTVNCCSGYFDIVRRDWDDELLSLAGIGREKLPTLVPPQHVAGATTEAAARALGVPEGVPVVAGMLDQCASALGAGNILPGSVCETTGTALAIAATLNDYRPSEMTRPVPMFCHGLPGRYMALPNCSAAGSLLTWFRDAFLSDAERASDAYGLINERVGAKMDRPGELILLPHFLGRLSPVSCPQARSVLYGLTLSTDRFDLARAVMEGVAYLLRENLELLGSLGVQPDEMISLGGAARSGVWLQIKADVCGLPMVTLRDGESTALGCALNAALALKLLSCEADIPRKIARRGLVNPEPSRRARNDEQYAHYLRLNAQMGYDV